MNTSKQIVIFVGPPGSGKGSLSGLCTENLNWVQLSTGNLCRKHIAEQTEIGRQIDEALRAGKLISDQLIISMVDSWLLEQEAENVSVILDGYPRTVVQAQALNTVVTTKLKSFNVSVIKLFISDEHVIARLSGRSVCQNKDCQAVYSLLLGSSLAPKQHMTCDKCTSPLIRRSDDEHEAIRERLKTYYKYEKDLLDFYTTSGIKIHHVEVEKPLHDVFSDFKKLMGLPSL